MSQSLRLEVITLQKTVFSADVELLIARALDGDIGVLPGHAPLITALDVAPLLVKTGGSEQQIATSGGFMDITPEGVTILAATAEVAEQIDYDRALRAKQRAEERLVASRADIDVRRAELALRRALSRIRVYEWKHR